MARANSCGLRRMGASGPPTGEVADGLERTSRMIEVDRAHGRQARVADGRTAGRRGSSAVRLHVRQAKPLMGSTQCLRAIGPDGAWRAVAAAPDARLGAKWRGG